MSGAKLEELVDEVSDAGGGLSSDEPAMKWPIYVVDHHGTRIAAETVVVRDGAIEIGLRADFKVGLS